MSAQPVASSITPRRVDETRTDQVQRPELLVAGTAELRRDVDDLHGRAKGLHRDSQETQLSIRTHDLSLVAPELLLDELAISGMAWALVARIVGVTPAAVRKWRRGETVTAGNHRDLAEFVAFCRLLRERNPLIDDVDQWLHGTLDEARQLVRLPAVEAFDAGPARTLAMPPRP